LTTYNPPQERNQDILKDDPSSSACTTRWLFDNFSKWAIWFRCTVRGFVRSIAREDVRYIGTAAAVVVGPDRLREVLHGRQRKAAGKDPEKRNGLKLAEERRGKRVGDVDGSCSEVEEGGSGRRRLYRIRRKMMVARRGIFGSLPIEARWQGNRGMAARRASPLGGGYMVCGCRKRPA
jgi:hypothetical protein